MKPAYFDPLAQKEVRKYLEKSTREDRAKARDFFLTQNEEGIRRFFGLNNLDQQGEILRFVQSRDAQQEEQLHQQQVVKDIMEESESGKILQPVDEKQPNYDEQDDIEMRDEHLIGALSLQEVQARATNKAGLLTLAQSYFFKDVVKFLFVAAEIKDDSDESGTQKCDVLLQLNGVVFQNNQVVAQGETIFSGNEAEVEFDVAFPTGKEKIKLTEVLEPQYITEEMVETFMKQTSKAQHLQLTGAQPAIIDTLMQLQESTVLFELPSFFQKASLKLGDAFKCIQQTGLRITGLLERHQKQLTPEEADYFCNLTFEEQIEAVTDMETRRLLREFSVVRESAMKNYEEQLFKTQKTRASDTFMQSPAVEQTLKLACEILKEFKPVASTRKAVAEPKMESGLKRNLIEELALGQSVEFTQNGEKDVVVVAGASVDMHRNSYKCQRFGPGSTLVCKALEAGRRVYKFE